MPTDELRKGIRVLVVDRSVAFEVATDAEERYRERFGEKLRELLGLPASFFDERWQKTVREYEDAPDKEGFAEERGSPVVTGTHGDVRLWARAVSSLFWCRHLFQALEPKKVGYDDFRSGVYRAAVACEPVLEEQPSELFRKSFGDLERFDLQIVVIASCHLPDEASTLEQRLRTLMAVPPGRDLLIHFRASAERYRLNKAWATVPSVHPDLVTESRNRFLRRRGYAELLDACRTWPYGGPCRHPWDRVLVLSSRAEADLLMPDWFDAHTALYWPRMQLIQSDRRWVTDPAYTERRHLIDPTKPQAAVEHLARIIELSRSA